MVAPYTQATQNNNKCPHGFPIGACPICSGMSAGSSKDRDKPRKPGEMSYNECMAAWIKIQAANEARMQAKIDRLEQTRESLLQSRIMAGIDKIQKTFDKIMQNIEKVPSVLKTPAKFVMKFFVAPIVNLISKIPGAINNIQVFLSNITQMINSVSEKMAMILGEVKNFINAQFLNKTKKALKTILNLFAQSEEEDNNDEEVKKLKAREMKKILKSLFRIKNKDEDKNKENHESKSAGN